VLCLGMLEVPLGPYVFTILDLPLGPYVFTILDFHKVDVSNQIWQDLGHGW